MAGGNMAHVIMSLEKAENPNNYDEAQQDLRKSIRQEEGKKILFFFKVSTASVKFCEIARTRENLRKKKESL